MKPSPIIVALDFSTQDAALDFVRRIPADKCRVKVGFELFVAAGPGLIEKLHELGFEVFLDLKFNDIPNTVASVCRGAADLGVWMLNVHASGGRRMISAAREALDQAAHQPYLIAVTVLTSMDATDLGEVGIARSPEQQVLHLAGLASDAGADGVVCSAREAAALRQELGSDFLLVTPGIRPAGSTGSDDQRRVMTPAEAMTAGSDFLVIGRPITQADAPGDVINEVLVSL